MDIFNAFQFQIETIVLNFSTIFLTGQYYSITYLERLPSHHKTINRVSQYRWDLVTVSVTLELRTFCQEYVAVQIRGLS